MQQPDGIFELVICVDKQSTNEFYESRERKRLYNVS